MYYVKESKFSMCLNTKFVYPFCLKCDNPFATCCMYLTSLMKIENVMHPEQLSKIVSYGLVVNVSTKTDLKAEGYDWFLVGKARKKNALKIAFAEKMEKRKKITTLGLLCI